MTITARWFRLFLLIAAFLPAGTYVIMLAAFHYSAFAMAGVFYWFALDTYRMFFPKEKKK